MPEDLKEILFAIVRGQISKTFRGVAPQDFLKWIKILGHRQKSGHFIKSFRFRPEDKQLLQSLKRHREESDISVIRRALEHLRKEYKTSIKLNKNFGIGFAAAKNGEQILIIKGFL